MKVGEGKMTALIIIIAILILIALVVLNLRIRSLQKLLHIYIEKYKEEQKKCYTAKMRYHLMGRLEENNVRSKFAVSGIKKLFIYGAGNHGKLLMNILITMPDIEVKGFIEGKASMTECNGRKVYNIPDLSKQLLEDATIIVTPIFAYDEIKTQLMHYTEQKYIIGLDQII